MRRFTKVIAGALGLLVCTPSVAITPVEQAEIADYAKRDPCLAYSYLEMLSNKDTAAQQRLDSINNQMPTFGSNCDASFEKQLANQNDPSGIMRWLSGLAANSALAAAIGLAVLVAGLILILVVRLTRKKGDG